MVNVQSLRGAVQKLAPEFRLKLALLFGSQVSGRTHAQSDIDIGVIADHPLRPRELADLSFRLSQIGRLTNIEVADLKSQPPLMLKNIAEESVLLYEEAPNLYDRFKIYGLKRHMEAKPLYQARARELEQFLAKHA